MVTKKSNSQHLATISLIAMAVGFIATIPMPPSTWKSILQGGFEAGLVGGLADWFAVTALFRHPMGLPIPHTALLPKNREKIIAKIISLVQNEWLTKQSIKNKIDTFQFTDKLFTIAENEINNEPMKKNTIELMKKAINKVEIEKISPFVEKELKSQLNNLDLSHYFPLVIEQIQLRKYDEKGLEYILKEIDIWARRDSTKYRLGGMAVEMIENIKADGFMQLALRSFSNFVNEDKLGSLIQNLIVKGVDSFRDPYNPNRQNLLNHINEKLQSLKSNETLTGELNQVKLQIIEKWEPGEFITDSLSKVKERVIQFIDEPSFYNQYIFPILQNSLNEITTNPEKVEQLDNWIKKHISNFVEQNHSKIGNLVKENLDKLDNKTLIHMIETNVGKDLQWIRVNGAVCGFIIGLLLVGIKSLF